MRPFLPVMFSRFRGLNVDRARCDLRSSMCSYALARVRRVACFFDVSLFCSTRYVSRLYFSDFDGTFLRVLCDNACVMSFRFRALPWLIACVFACVSVSPVYAGPNVLYSGTVVGVLGTIGVGSTLDRLQVSQPDGTTVSVLVVSGRTFVSSRDLLRPGQTVKIEGVFSSVAGEAVVLADSVEPSQPTEFDPSAKHDGRLSTMRYVLGAAAGIILGSGTMLLRHVLDRNAQTLPGSPPVRASISSGTVSF